MLMGCFYSQGKSSAVILKFELMHSPTSEIGLVNDVFFPVLGVLNK